MNQIIGEGRITIRLRALAGELWFDVGNSVRIDATWQQPSSRLKNRRTQRTASD